MSVLFCTLGGKMKKILLLLLVGLLLVGAAFAGEPTWNHLLTHDIPTDLYRVYYFNTNDMKTVATEVVKNINISYIYSDFHNIDSNDFGAYYAGYGNFEEGIYEFNISESWSDTKVYIDGTLIMTQDSDSVLKKMTAGKHLIQIEYTNNWHTTDFSFNYKKNTHEYTESELEEKLIDPLKDGERISERLDLDLDTIDADDYFHGYLVSLDKPSKIIETKQVRNLTTLMTHEYDTIVQDRIGGYWVKKLDLDKRMKYIFTTNLHGVKADIYLDGHKIFSGDSYKEVQVVLEPGKHIIEVEQINEKHDATFAIGIIDFAMTDQPATTIDTTNTEASAETTSSVPTSGEVLKSLEIISGDDRGDLNETGDLNRAELAILILKLNKVDFATMQPTLSPYFDDVDSDAWYFRAVQYCKDMEWLSGTGERSFSPYAKVSQEMINTVLLKSLGYIPTWGESTGKIHQLLGKNIDVINKDQLTRGETFDYIVDAFKLEHVSRGETLEAVLGLVASNEAVKEGQSNVELPKATVDNVIGHINNNGTYTFIDKAGQSIPSKDYMMPKGDKIRKIRVNEAGVVKEYYFAKDGKQLVEGPVSETILFNGHKMVVGSSQGVILNDKDEVIKTFSSTFMKGATILSASETHVVVAKDGKNHLYSLEGVYLSDDIDHADDIEIVSNTHLRIGELSFTFLYSLEDKKIVHMLDDRFAVRAISDDEYVFYGTQFILFNTTTNQETVGDPEYVDSLFWRYNEEYGVFRYNGYGDENFNVLQKNMRVKFDEKLNYAKYIDDDCFITSTKTNDLVDVLFADGSQLKDVSRHSIVETHGMLLWFDYPMTAYLPSGKTISTSMKANSYRMNDDYIVFNTSSKRYYFDHELNPLSNSVFNPVLEVFPTGHIEYTEEYKNGSGIKDASGHIIESFIRDAFYSERTGLLVMNTYDGYKVIDKNNKRYDHFEVYNRISDGGDYLCVYDGSHTYLVDADGNQVLSYEGSAYFYTN